MPFPTVARATADQAPTLTAIALAAKRHWGYPERWLEAWTADLTITAEYLATQPCYTALHDGEPVAFYALVMAASEPRARLDHLWVRPDWIGRGLGRVLFEHAMATAAAAGAGHLAFDAEPHAEPFYLHMGARRIGERRGQVEGQPRLLPIMEIQVRHSPAGHGDGGDGGHCDAQAGGDADHGAARASGAMSGAVAGSLLGGAAERDGRGA